MLRDWRISRWLTVECVAGLVGPGTLLNEVEMAVGEVEDEAHDDSSWCEENLKMPI
jgi:hypothetical protein